MPVDVQLERFDGLDSSPFATGEPTTMGCCNIVRLDFNNSEVSDCGDSRTITGVWTAEDARDGRGSNAPEDPDFGFIQEPTFVSLVTFTGSPVAGGLVELEWVTAVEFQNLGFNVYRPDSVHGERTLINSQMTPSCGGSFGGVYGMTNTRCRKS